MTFRLRGAFLLWTLLAAWPAALPAMGFLVSEEEQRRDYLAAQTAIRAGNISKFQSLLKSLDGYILHGYLEYEYLKDRVATTPAPELHRFLEDNDQAPIADTIRKKWLDHPPPPGARVRAPGAAPGGERRAGRAHDRD